MEVMVEYVINDDKLLRRLRMTVKNILDAKEKLEEIHNTKNIKILCMFR